MPLDSKHTEAHFWPKLTHSLHLQLANLPRSQDLALFVSMTTITEPIALPHMHACGVNL